MHLSKKVKLSLCLSFESAVVRNPQQKQQIKWTKKHLKQNKKLTKTNFIKEEYIRVAMLDSLIYA